MSITYPKIKMLLGAGHSTEVWFDKADIIEASIIRETHPLSLQIPIGILEFTFYSTSSAYSIFSDGDYFNQLSKRQPIDVYESVDSVDRYLGKFYLDDWENIGGYKIKFTAFDLVGVADASQFDGYYWDSATSVEDIISAILDPVNIPYSVDAGIASDTYTGWIPPGTCREALQQICIAAGAMVLNADDDELTIAPSILPINTPTADGSISDSEKTETETVKLLPLVTSIEVISHDYVASSVEETIYEDTLAVGEYKVVFNEPYYDIDATGVGFDPIYITTEGGDELATEDTSEDTYIVIGGTFEYGSNSIFLNVLTPGAVEVTGYKWIDNKQSHVFTENGLDAYVTRNDKTIKDATMVSLSNVDAVLGRLKRYFRQRYQQESTLFPVSFKVGDCVNINSIDDTEILCAIEKMDYSLTKGFLSKVRLVGIEPFWWLAGGIDPSYCVAAYLAKGAGSIVTSLNDLSGNGNTLTGTYPGYTNAHGWMFDGSNDYLDTGINTFHNFGQNNTYVVKIEAPSQDGSVFGMLTAGYRMGLGFWNGDLEAQNDGIASPTQAYAAGVYIITGDKVYKDGVDYGETITESGGTNPYNCLIGCRSGVDGDPDFFSDAYVHAIAFYQGLTLTTTEVAALNAAVSAL